MKNVLWLIAVMIVCCAHDVRVVGAQPAKSIQVHAQDPENYGEAEPGSTVSRRVRVVNQSSEWVVVEVQDKSCGCLDVELVDGGRISPGGSMIVAVRVVAIMAASAQTHGVVFRVQTGESEGRVGKSETFTVNLSYSPKVEFLVYGPSGPITEVRGVPVELQMRLRAASGKQLPEVTATPATSKIRLVAVAHVPGGREQIITLRCEDDHHDVNTHVVFSQVGKADQRVGISIRRKDRLVAKGRVRLNRDVDSFELSDLADATIAPLRVEDLVVTVASAGEVPAVRLTARTDGRAFTLTFERRTPAAGDGTVTITHKRGGDVASIRWTALAGPVQSK